MLGNMFAVLIVLLAYSVHSAELPTCSGRGAELPGPLELLKQPNIEYSRILSELRIHDAEYAHIISDITLNRQEGSGVEVEGVSTLVRDLINYIWNMIGLPNTSRELWRIGRECVDALKLCSLPCVCFMWYQWAVAWYPYREADTESAMVSFVFGFCITTWVSVVLFL
jgi:hypothetical protein